MLASLTPLVFLLDWRAFTEGLVRRRWVSDCTLLYESYQLKVRVGLTLGSSGSRHRRRLVITKIEDFRTTPRHSPCFSVDGENSRTVRYRISVSLTIAVINVYIERYPPNRPPRQQLVSI